MTDELRAIFEKTTVDERPLAGQHALVTGAGRGIGAAIAARLAAAGCDLTLLGRDWDRLKAQSGAIAAEHDITAYEVQADITEPDEIERAFEWAGNMLGPVSILVNNAGAAASTPFHRMSPEHWLDMIDVNLHGTFLCCRAAVPAMLERGGGRIINVASTAGQKGYAYVAAYCAAKHGVIGLTRALAVEYAAKGITVNAVCPGFTETGMTVESLRNIMEKTGRSEDEARRELTRHNPQGRLVTPEEVADAVGWLASPAAAAITGQAIAVAGGEVMP